MDPLKGSRLGWLACGFTQQEEVDYHETFSPMVKIVTVSLVLSLAAINCWPVYHIDVTCAFLHGDLFEEVYMSLPPGFSNRWGNKICRLKKSLYGLKQASRQWNIKLTQALTDSGFTQSHYDYSIC